MWAESIAVGSEPFVKAAEATLKNRRRVEISEALGAHGHWVLRECGGMGA